MCPTEVQKCRRLTVPTRVEFLSLPQAQRVPPTQPEPLPSHQSIDTHGSNDHACHRGCNSLFDEGSQVVDDRPVHNNSTCLCFHGSPPLVELLPLLLEGLDLPADLPRCLHIAPRCPVWPQLLHLALRNRHLTFSWPALPQQAHVDITVRISIGVGRSFAFFRPAFVSVSRASSPNEVMFTCLISFCTSATCPQGCQVMSTGTETRLRASPLQQSCRIVRVSFQTRSCRSVH